MRKEFTKEDVIANKKEAIKSLNKLLEGYINDPSGNHLKKAHLLSYWIKDYVHMIGFEERFDPKKNIAYKRGNIVKLTFGFNIGSEYGGLHYGIVIDNHNSHSSPVLTVIPLTSTKDRKTVHPNSVMLGNELYRLIKIKYDTISKGLKEEQEEINNTVEVFSSLLHSIRSEITTANDAGSLKSISLSELEQNMEVLQALRHTWSSKRTHNLEQQEYLKKIGAEIDGMKEGSIALVNQITTVSKIRIFDPRNLKGVLAGISLSAESMDKINQRLKDLYIF